MDLLTKIRDHILVTVTIIGAGVFAIIASVVKGYFGLAVTAFIGILACTTVLVFILPIALIDKDKNRGEGK